jgi:hypothetical protein
MAPKHPTQRQTHDLAGLCGGVGGNGISAKVGAASGFSGVLFVFHAEHCIKTTHCFVGAVWAALNILSIVSSPARWTMFNFTAICFGGNQRAEQRRFLRSHRLEGSFQNQ